MSELFLFQSGFNKIRGVSLYYPAAHAKDALIEACDAGIKLIVCITEGIPVHDVMKTRAYLKERGTTLIGPNTPGIIVPGENTPFSLSG